MNTVAASEVSLSASHPHDHFSAIAREYSRGRFGYPDALFEYLAGLCANRDAAWDCATGAGQAVPSLAQRFSVVHATDVSTELLARVPCMSNVHYSWAPAEDCGLDGSSFDLITVAQALHWFDQAPFWQEVSRVTKPGALLAFWGYVWPTVTPVVDSKLGMLRQELASYWPDRSEILHDAYRSVVAPFEEIMTPEFEINIPWRRKDYLAHIASWSAARYHREDQGPELLELFAKELKKAWPDDVTHAAKWPLCLRVFRVE